MEESYVTANFHCRLYWIPIDVSLESPRRQTFGHDLEGVSRDN